MQHDITHPSTPLVGTSTPSVASNKQTNCLCIPDDTLNNDSGVNKPRRTRFVCRNQYKSFPSPTRWCCTPMMRDHVCCACVECLSLDNKITPIIRSMLCRLVIYDTAHMPKWKFVPSISLSISLSGSPHVCVFCVLGGFLWVPRPLQYVNTYTLTGNTFNSSV